MSEHQEEDYAQTAHEHQYKQQMDEEHHHTADPHADSSSSHSHAHRRARHAHESPPRLSFARLLLCFLVAVLVPVVTGVIFLFAPLGAGSNDCANQGHGHHGEGPAHGGGGGISTDPDGIHDGDDVCRSVSVSAYILIHQGMYALFSTALTVTIMDVAFPLPFKRVAAASAGAAGWRPASSLSSPFSGGHGVAGVGGAGGGSGGGGVSYERDWVALGLSLCMPLFGILVVWLTFAIAYLEHPSLINAPLTHTLGPFAVSFIVYVRYFYLAYQIYKLEQEQARDTLQMRRLELANMQHSSSPAAASNSVDGTPALMPSPPSDLSYLPEHSFIADDNDDDLEDVIQQSFLHSRAGRHLLFAVFLQFWLLAAFFFCQWCSVYFGDVQSIPGLQFLTFLLFVVVMAFLNSITQRIAAVMDKHVLLGASAHSPVSHPASRPELTILMSSIIAWFFCIFYRTLFTSMEAIPLFVAISLLNDGLELALFFGKFHGSVQRALIQVATKVRVRRAEAKQATMAFKRNQSSSSGGNGDGLAFSVRSRVAFARLLWWRILCALYPMVDVAHVRQETAIEYIMRSCALFSSLLTMLFTTAYWQTDSTAYHTALYTPWTTDHHHYQSAMQFLAISGAVEMAMLIAVYLFSQRLFEFKVREAAERILQHKRAFFFVVVAGIHITNDLYVAHFRPDRIKI